MPLNKNNSLNNKTKNEWLAPFADPLMLAIAWVVALSSICAGIAPRLLVALLIVFTLLAVLFLVGTGNPDLQKIKKSPLFLTSLVFTFYVLLSASWSAWPLTAVQKSLWLAFILLAVISTLILSKQMSPMQLYRCARGIVAGLLIGMIFPLVEYASDFTILSFLATHFPDLVKTSGTAKQIPAYYLNNSVATLVLLFWPALLIAFAWRDKQQKKLIFLALTSVLLFILYKTESATAQLAFILSIITFLFARYAPHKIDLVTRSLWTLAVLGVIPVILAANYIDLQNAPALPYSFRDRLHIWNYTAKQVPQNPVFGIGIRSSRANKIEKHNQLKRSGRGGLIDHKGWHSHNIFLQIWHELGAVGAGFLLAIGLLLLRAIGRIAAEKRPFAYATFTSFCTIGAFGYGMWQSWLLSAYGWSIIFLLIGIHYGEGKGVGHESSPMSNKE